MLFTKNTLVALLTLESTALAASSFSTRYCLTQLGKSSVRNVPSKTLTINIPLTVTTTSTSTPVKTVTPAPLIDTITSTVTIQETSTAPTNTATATVTDTATITSVSTDFATATSTVTTTTQTISTSTSNVPTPAGFTPVSQGGGYVPKIKGRGIPELAARQNGRDTCRIDKGSKTPVFSPNLYPQRVDCVALIKTVVIKTKTVTATTTRVSTLMPTTKTTTTTETATTTVIETPPDTTATVTESTTITETSTTTSSATTVETVTAVETAIVPGPTIYAACQTDNIVSRANGGQGILAFRKTSAQSFVILSNVTPEECCIRCQQTTNCRGTAFVGSNCNLITGGQCTPGAGQGENFQTSGRNVGFIVSNGPCGLLQNGGSTGS